jgi:hypothetical protein
MQGDFFSLHFVGFAFAIENVSRFFDAFVLTPLRVIATADVGANLVTASNSLSGCSHWRFLIFSHYQVPLSCVRVNIEIISHVLAQSSSGIVGPAFLERNVAWHFSLIGVPQGVLPTDS